jgi:hypothetical protein
MGWSPLVSAIDRLTSTIQLDVRPPDITFQQPNMFAVCLDIGGPYARAMVSAMNTASQIGSFASSLAFGYLVAHCARVNARDRPRGNQPCLSSATISRVNARMSGPLVLATDEQRRPLSSAKNTYR